MISCQADPNVPWPLSSGVCQTSSKLSTDLRLRGGLNHWWRITEGLNSIREGPGRENLNNWDKTSQNIWETARIHVHVSAINKFNKVFPGLSPKNALSSVGLLFFLYLFWHNCSVKKSAAIFITEITGNYAFILEKGKCLPFYALFSMFWTRSQSLVKSTE